MNKQNNVGVSPLGDPSSKKSPKYVGADASVCPQKRNTQTGITLIALVITIIILLILAMVSIRLVMNSGIITRAEKGVDEYSKAQEDEQWKLYQQEVKMDNYSNANIELTEEEAKLAGWEWDTNGYLTKYIGTATELYFPSKIGNISIKGISGAIYSLSNNENIIKIVIPGVDFSHLEVCNIPNLKTVILKEGITRSPTYYAFHGCKNLHYLVLPSSLTEIDSHALGTAYFTQVVIPKNVTTVGKSIFGWCYGGPITVYCEAESKPDGWDDAWLDNAPEGTQVVWGYKGN